MTTPYFLSMMRLMNAAHFSKRKKEYGKKMFLNYLTLSKEVNG